jgi:hypothetical protein
MDFWVIFGVCAFVAGGLLLIPLDKALEERREARRRNDQWRLK